ncbi:hypothetical protein CAPTEDRAFT_226862 [Capitella teleta]|uniref:Calcium uniporter protein n=1 Tax=Capitella teleta TaxID=283909 RepID=R7U192_CAPTE|nr:hypothetical protein CAPTEDRAFT_226862 [Capitella teleta]|eukprot:ELT99754.1 hypothetical protein CAPTEDRAFT_226862 [Capitella teleta]
MKRIVRFSFHDRLPSRVDVRFQHGLPVLSIPLPSRQERCQFTLRPISNNLGDLVQFMQAEDKGIDRVTAYNEDGERIAQSTPIEMLLSQDFQLKINDVTYNVTAPHLELSEHVTQLDDVKSAVAQIYSALNVEQHQLEQERKLRASLEQLQTQLQPLEKVKLELDEHARKRTSRLGWMGLGLMGVQFGVLSRLTWWEYSWDIMEPVTYFVTYGTSMVMFAYYVLTKQEYNYPEVRDREYLLSFHKNANKQKFDVSEYNRLREAITLVEYDLKRLRDPLQVHLPLQHMERTKAPVDFKQ